MPNKLEEKDWALLLQRIKEGKCTPFIGAGACAGKIPVGSQIASEWAKKYDYPMQDSYDLIHVAQFVAVTEDSMTTKEEICKKIKELLKGVTNEYFETPDELYGVLADLPLPVYLTTNYDDLLERALESRGKEPIQEICRWNKRLMELKTMLSDFDPTPERPLVFHLHGSCEVPESLVLTEDDYLDFLAAISEVQKMIPPRIQDAFAGTSLLFLGYSIADWDLKVIFQLFTLRSISRTHMSVQLVPSNVSEAQKKEAQEYLDKYFEGLHIQVYWQDCREFAAELKTRWERLDKELQVKKEKAAEKEKAEKILQMEKKRSEKERAENELQEKAESRRHIFKILAAFCIIIILILIILILVGFITVLKNFHLLYIYYLF